MTDLREVSIANFTVMTLDAAMEVLVLLEGGQVNEHLLTLLAFVVGLLQMDFHVRFQVGRCEEGLRA